MSKRILSLVLALVMVLGTFGSMVFAANDVEGTVYEDAVERLELLKVLEGYPDGTFKPENQITRAEFAAVVVRAKGLEAVAQATKGLSTGFTDVPATSWASGYVGTAAKMGIINGVGNGLFAPEAPVKYEEAVTMLMRALGYEEAAKARGGYPYGHLIVAKEAGLLDKVKGTQGVPALRGVVAQLTDNALGLRMMIQVGYGAQTKWVVSGTEDTEPRYLLDDMGFNVATGRVTSVDENKNLIRIGANNLTVDKDFDFNLVKGLRIKAWSSGGKVVLFTLLDTPIFDAVEYDRGQLYLVGEDKNLDLATDKDGKDAYTLLLNNKTVKPSEFDADYAKVILDSYGDVVWAEGYTLEGNIVVEKVDGFIVESFGYEELSLRGFTIVKDGKTISLDDLEENDIVFYNNAAGVKFAVVYNNGVEGEIGKLYANYFIFEGEEYGYNDAKYLDGEVLGDLDSGVVNSIKTEGKEVTIFVDFAGNLVLMAGSLEEQKTSHNFFVVIDSRKYNDTRSGNVMYTLDVLNAEGKVAQYDLTEATVKAILKAHLGSEPAVGQVTTKWEELVEVTNVDSNDPRVSADKIVKLTFNSSGNVTGVKELEEVDISADLLTTAKYVANRLLLQNSAVVFRKDTATKYTDYSVTTWGDAEKEFTRVYTGSKAYGEDGKVVAIYANTTNAKVATANYTGLVTDVVKLRNGLVAEVTVIVAGEKKVFTIATGGEYDKLVENSIQKLSVNKHDEVTAVSTTEPVIELGAKVIRVNLGSRSIVTDKGTFYLEANHVVYLDRDELPMVKQRLSDVKVDDIIDLYRIAAGSSYVNYVVRGVVDTGNNNGGNGESVTYLVDAYSAGFSRVTLENVDGEKTNFLLADFDAIKDTDGTLATVAETKAMLGTKTLPNDGIFVEVKNNVLTFVNEEFAAVPAVSSKLTAAGNGVASANLVFSKALNADSRTKVKAIVDAAYTAIPGTGTATVSSAWNVDNKTLEVTVTVTGDGAVDLAALTVPADFKVVDLAGNSSVVLNVGALQN